MKSLPHVAIADGCRLLTLLCAGPRVESQCTHRGRLWINRFLFHAKII